MSDIEDRIVPDLEARLEEVVGAFRENHRHPANVALHVAGWALAASALTQVLRGRLGSGLFRAGLGVGLMVAGHRIEGNEPFRMLRTMRGGYDAGTNGLGG
jgi:hypothetical protein